MTNTVKPRRFWTIVALVAVGALWLLKPMLLPFVAGIALAYFLDPVVDKLEGLRVPRWAGTLLALISFLLFLVFLLLLIVPLLQTQLMALLDSLPGYIATLRERFLPQITAWLHKLSPHDVERLREAAGNYAGSAMGWAGQLLKKIVSEGFALFDVLTLLIITPVVSFYLLRDWPKVTHTVDTLVPRPQHGAVKNALKDINATLSGFLRGQALVCLSLAFIYGAGLTLVGLNYGATVGIIAGALSFIPYVGSGFGLVVSMILAIIQFDDWQSIAMVFGVFLVGQSLEGYVLTPKLVGDRVGLHPVWILFALFAGGSLLGFVGVLIAVPAAAVLGVLIRLGIKYYKNSSLYKDRS